MPTLRVADAEMFYRERGEGPPLLLLAGHGTDSVYWGLQLAGLSRDFRVIAPDHQGIGRSSRGTAPLTIERMAEDALGLLDRLEIASAHLLGHSMGGLIAQALALRAPERVRRLVLAASFCRVPARARFMAGLRGEILARLGARAYATLMMGWSYTLGFFEARGQEAWELRERWVRHLERLPLDPRVLAEQAEAVAALDLSERLGALACPTLVIVGEEDWLAPPELSRELAERIPGARLVVLPGAGHALNIERAPEFDAAVRAFLAG